MADEPANDDATTSEEEQLKISKLDEIESITSAMVAGALSLKEKYNGLCEEHKATLAAFEDVKVEYAKEQERGRKKQERELAEESASLKQKIADWEEEKLSIDKTQTLATRIKLDVGGTRFTTSRTTLTLYPDTMLGAMFSGRHAMNTDDEGYHFIDRDGTHFGHILNYLRDAGNICKFKVANLGDQSHVALLKSEANFYGMREIMFTSDPVTTTLDMGNYDAQKNSVIFLENERGVWGARCNNLSFELQEMTCCKACKSAFATWDSGHGMNGTKGFFENRKLMSEQPTSESCIACPPKVEEV